MKNNAAIWKGIGNESTQDSALVRALKLGLDVHYRQVTVAMHAQPSSAFLGKV
jgi:hypothetical protein